MNENVRLKTRAKLALSVRNVRNSRGHLRKVDLTQERAKRANASTVSKVWTKLQVKEYPHLCVHALHSHN
jgi:hypothetical protein